jgi:hypothetical protein
MRGRKREKVNKKTHNKGWRREREREEEGVKNRTNNKG